MTSPNCEDQSGLTKSSSWGEYVCPDVSASGENDRGKVSLQFCSSRTGYSGETDWEGCVFNSFDRSDHSAKVRFGECRVPNHAATFVLSEYRTLGAWDNDTRKEITPPIQPVARAMRWELGDMPPNPGND